MKKLDIFCSCGQYNEEATAERERREEMFVNTSNKMYLVSKVAEVRAEW